MFRVTTAGFLVLAASAFTQPAITIDVGNPTLMPGQSTTVTLFAGFEFSDFAMGHIETDVLTSVGSAGFSDHGLVEPMGTLSTTSPGTPTAAGFEGIDAQQLHHTTVPIYADPTNPIAFWRATYTAPIDPSEPFDIDLSTMTRRYDVYWSRFSVTTESRLADLTEGSATIHVIPAPASASLLALGLLAIRRRR